MDEAKFERVDSVPGRILIEMDRLIHEATHGVFQDALVRVELGYEGFDRQFWARVKPINEREYLAVMVLEKGELLVKTVVASKVDILGA